MESAFAVTFLKAISTSSRQLPKPIARPGEFLLSTNKIVLGLKKSYTKSLYSYNFFILSSRNIIVFL